MAWLRPLRWMLLLSMLAARSSAGGEIDWHTDLDPAWKQAREQNRPMLVFITTSGCRYCTLMQNTSFTDPVVVELLQSRFVPAAVDAKDVPWLVRDQKVGSYPMTIIVAPSSEIVDRIKGFLKAEELKARLEKSLPPTRTAGKEPAEKK